MGLLYVPDGIAIFSRRVYRIPCFYGRRIRPLFPDGVAFVYQTGWSYLPDGFAIYTRRVCHIYQTGLLYDVADGFAIFTRRVCYIYMFQTGLPVGFGRRNGQPSVPGSILFPSVGSLPRQGPSYMLYVRTLSAQGCGQPSAPGISHNAPCSCVATLATWNPARVRTRVSVFAALVEQFVDSRDPTSRLAGKRFRRLGSPRCSQCQHLHLIVGVQRRGRERFERA